MVLISFCYSSFFVSCSLQLGCELLICGDWSCSISAYEWMSEWMTEWNASAQWWSAVSLTGLSWLPVSHVNEWTDATHVFMYPQWLHTCLLRALDPSKEIKLDSLSLGGLQSRRKDRTHLHATVMWGEVKRNVHSAWELEDGEPIPLKVIGGLMDISISYFCK